MAPRNEPTRCPSADELSALIASGLSWIAIGGQFGMRESWARNLAKRLGVYDLKATVLASRPSTRKIDEKELRAMIAAGHGVSFLSQYFHVTRSSITAAAKRYGIDLSKYSKPPAAPTMADHRRWCQQIREQERDVWRQERNDYGASSVAGNWA